eukprot:454558_1
MLPFIRENPLLMHHSAYQPHGYNDFVRVVERVVEELAIYDDDICIEYFKCATPRADALLQRLRTLEEAIDDKELFLRQSGMILNDETRIFIQNHPLLFQYSAYRGYTIFERLVKEFGCNDLARNYFVVNPQNCKVDAVLNGLIMYKTEIKLDGNQFWKGIADEMQKNETVLSVILSHPLLFKQCAYKQSVRHTIVLERLVEEMQINHHLLYNKYLLYVLETVGFINELYITKECIISLYNLDNMETRMKGLISKCEFKVSFEENTHTFPDVTQFNIPIPETQILITHHLFCRATDVKGSGFIHVKSFDAVFGEYTFNNQNRNTPVRINQKLKVGYVGRYPICDGTVSICSASDLLIDKKGGINANECGLDYISTTLYNTERNEEYGVDSSTDTLPYGRFEEDQQSNDESAKCDPKYDAIAPIVNANGINTRNVFDAYYKLFDQFDKSHLFDAFADTANSLCFGDILNKEMNAKRFQIVADLFGDEEYDTDSICNDIMMDSANDSPSNIGNILASRNEANVLRTLQSILYRFHEAVPYNGFGGGIVDLVSASSVINNGLLTSNASNDYCSGGT